MKKDDNDGMVRIALIEKAIKEADIGQSFREKLMKTLENGGVLKQKQIHSSFLGVYMGLAMDSVEERDWSISVVEKIMELEAKCKHEVLEKYDKSGYYGSFFFAKCSLCDKEVELLKSSRCEECLGKMKPGASRQESLSSGPAAGLDITIYTCSKCGHVHEGSSSFD